MAYCQECGSEVAKIDVYCPFCGIALVLPEAETVSPQVDEIKDVTGKIAPQPFIETSEIPTPNVVEDWEVTPVKTTETPIAEEEISLTDKTEDVNLREILAEQETSKTEEESEIEAEIEKAEFEEIVEPKQIEIEPQAIDEVEIESEPEIAEQVEKEQLIEPQAIEETEDTEFDDSDFDEEFDKIIDHPKGEIVQISESSDEKQQPEIYADPFE